MTSLGTFSAADGLRPRRARAPADPDRFVEPSSRPWPCLQVTAGTSRFWVHDVGASIEAADTQALQGGRALLRATPSHYQDRKVILAARHSPQKLEYAFYQLDSSGAVVQGQRECFNAAAAVAHCYATGAAPASVLNRRTGQRLSVERLPLQDGDATGSSQWCLTRRYAAEEGLACFAPTRGMSHHQAGEVRASFYDQGNQFLLLDLGCRPADLPFEFAPNSMASLAGQAAALFARPQASTTGHLKIIAFFQPEGAAPGVLQARFFSGLEAHRSIPASGAMLLYRHAVERMRITEASLHLDGPAGRMTVQGAFVDLGGRCRVSQTSFLSRCSGQLWGGPLSEAAESEWAP